MEKESTAQKAVEVEALVAKFKAAKTIVAFDYIGLSVADFTNLRRELRKNGCEVKVYKNNISRRASEALGYNELVKYLVGPTAIAYSETDVVAPAKIVYEFSKTNDKVALEAGVIEGKVAHTEDIQTLAKLPSQETLLTMLAGAMLAPLRDLAIALNMKAEESAE